MYQEWYGSARRLHAPDRDNDRDEHGASLGLADPPPAVAPDLWGSRNVAEDFLHAKAPGGSIVDRCRLRRDYVVKIIVPNNLTTDEATRSAEHVRTLDFGAPSSVPT